MTHGSKPLEDVNIVREELAAIAKAWYDNRSDPNSKAAGEKLLEEKIIILREKEQILKEAVAKDQKEAEAWDKWRDQLITSVETREEKIRSITSAECDVLYLLLKGIKTNPAKAQELILLAYNKQWNYSPRFMMQLNKLQTTYFKNKESLLAACQEVEDWLMD